MRYFAYGSNMSLPRLRQRIPEVVRIGRFILAEHSLRFHKISCRDGSAKCDAYSTGHPEDQVIGIVFEIDAAAKPVLDAYEGLHHGYEEKTVIVMGPEQQSVEAFMYYATHIDSSLKPYSWYLQHVLMGATDCEFPPDYIEKLHTIATMEDTDWQRDAAERAIYR